MNQMNHLAPEDQLVPEVPDEPLVPEVPLELPLEPLDPE